MGLSGMNLKMVIKHGYKTWLNCERDISMISEKFPDVLITVYREHEDCCLTVQYFKYGKFIKEMSCQITISFEKFDETGHNRRRLQNRQLCFLHIQ